jgi:uncharacterized membrane protein YdjX (TVP38/TMEM64 family)
MLSRVFNLPDRMTAAMDWIESQGAAGAIAFIALYVLATVLAFPASLLTLGAGAVYGLGLGSPLVSLASTLGATAAFLVARYAARGWVARHMENNPKFRALDDGVAEEGWKIVFLTRLSPAFPFNLQNFGYGLTRIPTWHYVAASWVGMMPGTLMYVYLGHAAGSVAEESARTGSRTPAQWAVLSLGLAATAAVALLVARIARRKLAELQEST